MADNDYVGEVRRVITLAVKGATTRGAATVEAEHLLLAIAADGGPISDALADFGLDPDRIERLLVTEREAALAAIGFTAIDHSMLSATPRRSRPAWGASAKEAIARGAKLGRRDRQRIRTADLLVGILLADLGTVPRVLAFGDIDAEAVLGRIQRLAKPRDR
ncbi:MAG: Clp protease N-terminal domain-containing protein [Leifsonia sp.]